MGRITLGQISGAFTGASTGATAGAATAGPPGSVFGGIIGAITGFLGGKRKGSGGRATNSEPEYIQAVERHKLAQKHQAETALGIVDPKDTRTINWINQRFQETMTAWGDPNNPAQNNNSTMLQFQNDMKNIIENYKYTPEMSIARVSGENAVTFDSTTGNVLMAKKTLDELLQPTSLPKSRINWIPITLIIGVSIISAALISGRK